MPIHRVLRLGRGAIIALDSSEPDEIRILANNLPVAKGTVIVSVAVEAKELLPRAWRMLKPTLSRHDGTATGARPALVRKQAIC